MSRSNNTQTNDQTTEQQMTDSKNQITLIGATIARSTRAVLAFLATPAR